MGTKPLRVLMLSYCFRPTQKQKAMGFKIKMSVIQEMRFNMPYAKWWPLNPGNNEWLFRPFSDLLRLIGIKYGPLLRGLLFRYIFVMEVVWTDLFASGLVF